jgi:minor curlin subunit
MIQFVLTLLFAASHMTCSIAADGNLSGSRIDLRQLQSRTVDLDPAISTNKYNSLQIIFSGEGNQLFGVTSQANKGSVSAQSGTAGPIRIEQNGRDAQLRATRSGSNNRLSSVQGDLAMLLVSQRGDHNEIQVSQSGNNNAVTIEQTGSNNSISGHQSGANNLATITQAGTNHIAGYAQSGTGSTLSVRQH